MKKIKRAPAVCGGAAVCRKGNRGYLNRVLSTMGASQRSALTAWAPLSSPPLKMSHPTLCAIFRSCLWLTIVFPLVHWLLQRAALTVVRPADEHSAALNI